MEPARIVPRSRTPILDPFKNRAQSFALGRYPILQSACSGVNRLLFEDTFVYKSSKAIRQYVARDTETALEHIEPCDPPAGGPDNQQCPSVADFSHRIRHYGDFFLAEIVQGVSPNLLSQDGL